MALKVTPALLTWSGVTTIGAIASEDAAQETIESLGQSVFMHGQAESSDAPKGAESGRLFLQHCYMHTRSLVTPQPTRIVSVRACMAY